MQEKNLERTKKSVNETEVKDELENKGKTTEKISESTDEVLKTKAKEVEVEQNTKAKNGNKVWKVLNTITETIIWVLISILVCLLVLSTVSKKTDVLGYRLYVIMSGSMEPTIMTKQAVITKEIDEPQVNDVIAFGKDDFITVHRVIKEYTEGGNKLYQTKGDNNNTEDKELVSKDIVKGKVVAVLPFVGETILFLQSHLILLVIAIGVIIMIIVVRRLIFNE